MTYYILLKERNEKVQKRLKEQHNKKVLKSFLKFLERLGYTTGHYTSYWG